MVRAVFFTCRCPREDIATTNLPFVVPQAGGSGAGPTIILVHRNHTFLHALPRKLSMPPQVWVPNCRGYAQSTLLY